MLLEISGVTYKNISLFCKLDIVMSKYLMLSKNEEQNWVDLIKKSVFPATPNAVESAQIRKWTCAYFKFSAARA